MDRQFIETMQSQLSEHRVLNAQTYIKKLEGNLNDSLQFEDLKYEGYAALVLRCCGFQVEMRDSPDLCLRLDADRLYAEVKHFRRKVQDDHDQNRMEKAPPELLVDYGKVDAWQKVFEDIKDKVREYNKEQPFIIIIGSSSEHGIEDYEIERAVNYAQKPKARSDHPELEKLNGILFFSAETRLGDGGREVYFYPMSPAKSPLPASVDKRLKSITHWKCFAYSIAAKIRNSDQS